MKLSSLVNKKIKENRLTLKEEGLEDLDVNLPVQVTRFLDKVVTAIKGYKLNRKKEQLIVAKIIDALGMDKQELMMAIQKIKKKGILQKEDIQKLSSLIKESEDNEKLPNEIKKHFLEIISTYGNHREGISRKSDIRETAETLGAIADAAQEYTLREGGDWFDRVTIKRNMKELKSLCESFTKEAMIAKEQEQRLEALYEDMGHVLSRYFEIAEVSEAVMKERLGIKEKAPEGWEKTVKAMKDEPGVDNPWALAHWMKGKGYKSHK